MNKSLLCSFLRIITFLLTFLLLFFLFADNKVIAQQLAQSGKDLYTSPGLFTWVCPADVTCIKVECWGGGGRGGNQTIPGAGGGGGGGAYSRGSTITVVPGATYYVKVGDGSITTLPGGDSWFGPTGQPTDAVTLAKGGSSEADNGSSGALGGSAAGCIGDVKYSGGQGGRALFGYSGGGGGGAGTTGAGGNANVQIAGAGTPLYGGNGGAGLAVFGNGLNGFTCGGGGSGEKRDLTDYSAGYGANGQVVISFISAFQITPYNGSFCEGDIVNIGLSGSETGVSYQLLLDAVAMGGPVSGTGNAISFGDQGMVGTYTVNAALDSSSCTRMMNGYVVIHPAPEVNITGPTPVCSGSTGNIYLTQAGMSDYTWTVSPGGTVTAGGTPSDHTITITWNTAGSQTVSVNYTDGNGCSAATPAFFYVTVIQQSGDPASASATPATICNGQSATLTLTGGGGGSGSVIRWYTGSCGGTLAGTGNGLVVSPIVTTTYYGRYEDQPPCGNSACAQVTVTVNQKSSDPVSATATPASVCAGQSALLTLNGGGGGTGTNVRWYTASCGGTLVGTGNGLSVSPAATTTYYGRFEDPAPCSFNTNCSQVTVTVNPNPSVTLTGSPVTICMNDSSVLTANCTGGTVNTSYSGSSGNINVQIPESRVNWAGSNIPLTGSGGAILESTDIITVTLNINHTSNNQLDIFLVDPSGSRCMLLSSDNAGTGDNYSNAILQTGAIPNISILAGVNTTVTGTYGTEGDMNTLAPLGGGNGGNYAPAAVPQAVMLGASIDGSWSIRVFDDDNLGSLGVLVNWSISITRPVGFYTCVFSGPGTIGPVSYSGPYNSIATASVIPPVGTSSYTVTTTDALGCSVTSAPYNITVNPLPAANIVAKYCAVPGYIRLVAYPMPPGYSYLWSTGETTDSIDVDLAGVYWVKVTSLSTLCSATAFLTTATELVTDGTFTNFVPASPTFFTEYTQNQSYYTGVPSSGLWPEGYYAVNLSAWSGWPNPPQGYHPNFHGQDHTNNTQGPRNFMMINGSKELIGIPPHERVIWQQTVAVWPNTDYYFSAWAMNLNPASPAKLRFEVNGVQVGTIADLNLAPKPTSEGEVNLANYVRFYSNPFWNSGSATTAVIRIINLNLVAGGNDFGLDDISFGTLAPIPYDFDPEANGGGPVCEGGELALSANVEGGIGPFSYLWTGPDGWTSTLAEPVRSPVTMAMEGIYTVMVSDQGTNCPGFTSSLMVTVNTPPAATITGADPVCPLSSGNIYSGPPDMISYQWVCDGNGMITGPADGLSVSITAGAYCDSLFTLTLTVTDSSGCDSTCPKVVVTGDALPPVVTCPADTTLKADAGFTYATLALDPPGCSDNCTLPGELELSWIMTGATVASGTDTIPVPFLFNVDTTLVRYILTDHCDNSDTCTFLVVVLPNDPPEIECQDTLEAGTDEGLCTAAISPGFPTLLSGTPPISFTWEMTGATLGSGAGSITPDPYAFNLGLTVITWIAANVAGSDTCQQFIVVYDDEPPAFDPPDPFVFCVLDIDTASWNYQPEPLTDIEPERPEYYLVNQGNEVLDIDTSTYQDNCCDPGEPGDFMVHWRIDFSDGTSLPPLPGAYITGQPSEYGADIYLPGDGVLFGELIHTITYRLEDCHGNITDPALPVNITIKPRPKIIKIY